MTKRLGGAAWGGMGGKRGRRTERIRFLAKGSQPVVCVSRHPTKVWLGERVVGTSYEVRKYGRVSTYWCNDYYKTQPGAAWRWDAGVSSRATVSPGGME